MERIFNIKDYISYSVENNTVQTLENTNSKTDKTNWSGYTSL